MEEINFTRVKSPSHNNLQVYIDKNKIYIYKKYSNVKSYNKILNNYNYIKNFNFVPKMEFLENNIIKEEYCKPLHFYNKPLDYIPQVLNIFSELKKKKVFHNNIVPRHLMLKNNKVMLIDWDQVSIDNPKPAGVDSKLMASLYYCSDYLIIIILICCYIYYKK